MEPRPSQPPRRQHWGLRTLAFLGIAAASIIAANALSLDGDNEYALVTFIGMVVGLIGAVVCSVRGFRAWGGRLPRP